MGQSRWQRQGSKAEVSIVQETLNHVERVDDKIDLPENQKYISSVTEKKIETIGNRNSDLQTSRFKTNSQPYYVLLDGNEQMLNSPTGYNPDIETFIEFLDNAKAEFERRK